MRLLLHARKQRKAAKCEDSLVHELRKFRSEFCISAAPMHDSATFNSCLVGEESVFLRAHETLTLLDLGFCWIVSWVGSAS